MSKKNMRISLDKYSSSNMVDLLRIIATYHAKIPLLKSKYDFGKVVYSHNAVFGLVEYLNFNTNCKLNPFVTMSNNNQLKIDLDLPCEGIPKYAIPR